MHARTLRTRKRMFVFVYTCMHALHTYVCMPYIHMLHTHVCMPYIHMLHTYFIHMYALQPPALPTFKQTNHTQLASPPLYKQATLPRVACALPRTAARGMLGMIDMIGMLGMLGMIGML